MPRLFVQQVDHALVGVRYQVTNGANDVIEKVGQFQPRREALADSKQGAVAFNILVELVAQQETDAKENAQSKRSQTKECLFVSRGPY